jgi:hypothetical protein
MIRYSYESFFSMMNTDPGKYSVGAQNIFDPDRFH